MFIAYKSICIRLALMNSLLYDCTRETTLEDSNHKSLELPKLAIDDHATDRATKVAEIDNVRVGSWFNTLHKVRRICLNPTTWAAKVALLTPHSMSSLMGIYRTYCELYQERQTKPCFR